jgi:hypothetical protein
MNKYIIAKFLDDNGNPATGLVPTIVIQNIINDDVVINGSDMKEVGNGVYKYLFLTYDPNILYYFTCDAGSSISNRYSDGSSASLSGADLWDLFMSDHLINGTFGDWIQNHFQGVGI